HANDALVAARGDASGLRADGPGQGARGARGGLEPCAQERPDPPDHGGRPPGRLPARGRRRDRRGLHPARRGPAPLVGCLPARLPTRAGDDPLREPPFHALEPLRRSDLRRGGPADPAWIAEAFATPWWRPASCWWSCSSAWPPRPAGWCPTIPSR